MADRELRLRLQVRRHGLPDVNLLWNAPTGPDSTISKLVEKVNEVVPLESADWGFEDYVVELRSADGTSFECLHFQQVDKVLKDEDQVIIRSLLTDDIRIRRASGRHQITSDGRHLVDGVAYGRRWLNAPRNRPPVDLPPRKRARIEQSEYDDDDEGSPPLLLDYPPHLRRDGSRRTTSVRFAGGYDDEDLDDDDEYDDNYEEDEQDRRPVYNTRSSSRGHAIPSDVLADELRRLNGDLSAHGTAADRPPRPDAPTPLTAVRGRPLVRKRKAEDALSSSGESSSHVSEYTTTSAVESAVSEESDGDDTVIRHPQVYEAAHVGSDRSSMPSMLQEFIEHEAAQGYTTTVRQTGPNTIVISDGEGSSESESESGSELESESEFDASPVAHPPVNFGRAAKPSNKPPKNAISDSEDSSSGDSESESGSEFESESEAPVATATAVKREGTKAVVVEDSSSGESGSDSESGSEDESESDAPATAATAIKPAASSKPTNKSPRKAVRDESSSGESESESGSDLESGSESDSGSDEDSEDGSSDSDDAEDSNTKPAKGAKAAKPTPKVAKAAPKAAKPSSKPASKAARAAQPESEASSSSSSDVSSDSDISSDSSGSSGSSDDDSDLSSDSDSEPDEVSSKPAVAHITNLDKTPADKSRTDKPEPSAATQPTTSVAPGQGMAKTQRRNLRRRLAKAGGRTGQLEAAETETSETTTATELTELQLRKQALLDLMHVDTPEKPESGKKAKSAAGASAPTPYAPGNFPASLDETVHDKPEEIAEETVGDAAKSTSEDASTSPTVQRRLKLNVDAGRRILFGALGFTNPKTKAAEEKVRDKLMKDVRPLKNHRAEEEAKAAAEQAMEVDAPVEEEDPDAWRKRINYRAVECCQEGIELSEPPFPFVQRWDPQQQGNFSKKKGKRKRAQQAAQHEEEAADANHKKAKVGGEAETPDESWAAWEDSAVDDVVLNYDDPPSILVANESQFSDLDDLPALPADVTTLPALLPGAARPGMVITHKHWRLGGQDSWGPELVDQTAVVVKAEGDDGSQIRLLLAKRDREPESDEKEYDEVTGQRIYGRFEVPDFEDEDDGSPKGPDDGYRTLNFSELIDPRIVQQPPKAYDVDPETSQKDGPLPESVVQETQFEEMDVEAPTSAQPDAIEQQSSSTETMKGSEKEQVVVQQVVVQQVETSRSESLDKTGGGSPARLQTNSPSRQLRAEQPVTSPKPDAASDASQDVVPDSVPEASTDGGIHSGRQPDPDFLGDDIGNSPERLVHVSEDTSQELTPKAQARDAKSKAEPAVSTPKRSTMSSTPSSAVSLPTLDDVWNTATTSRNLRSMSKSGPESPMLKLKSEFAGPKDGQSTPKKNLFPNSTQPVTGSVFSPLNDKPKLRLSNTKTRRTSTFTIPEGSQVVALSSDDDDDAPPLEEHYAEDDIDADYEVAKRTPPKGKTRAQKPAVRRGAARGRGKAAASRAVSMPASARQVIRRGTASATSVYNKGKPRRSTSIAWDGEI
ncbi:hypothetical protein B0T11DRAFT_285054 [Plectosphaerella cucumerina]|uniref:DUF7357 domain-containing protein n=1 Tax=Plectosphaerella cucumerina TaxID=40658 RepID=A0A8K0TDT3_9PEZI|nr:hypothetical protein B0T11DRAFT_285054 [Plectosphaerella cucumerina]